MATPFALPRRMLIDNLLNFLFPVACILCRAIVRERRWAAVCPACWAALIPVEPPLCLRCGIPAVAIEGTCGACRAGDTVFDYARSAVLFNDAARDVIHHLKYSDRVSLAKPIGRWLSDVYEREAFRSSIIIPVPLHASRMRERGYNQAEQIARGMKLRFEPGLVRRRKKTPSQTGLSRAARIRNLSAAFELRGEVKGGSFLLVDDVMTTGATMNELTRLLKRHGAARVEVLTFARVPEGISPR